MITISKASLTEFQRKKDPEKVNEGLAEPIIFAQLF